MNAPNGSAKPESVALESTEESDLQSWNAKIYTPQKLTCPNGIGKLCSRVNSQEGHSSPKKRWNIHTLFRVHDINVYKCSI